MKILKTITLVATLSLVVGLRADSPITSTEFYKAYKEFGMVKAAKASGVLSVSMARYLSNPKNPIGIKAAIINARGRCFVFNG